ncbi:hypothetical protein ACO0SA_003226 [Hanseniaspora valbyensis]
MAKNSQLQRLKSKLKENGLHGVRYASKKSKQRAKLSSKEDDGREEKIQEIRDSMNMFDKTVKSHKKANILANANTNSNSKTTDKRQLEYEAKLMSYNVNKANLNKNNTFKDNRFGERGFSGLSEEEKTLERYKLEQIKQFEEQQSELSQDYTSMKGGRKAKKSLYNLEDDAEEEDSGMFKLTHAGHSLFDDDEYEQIIQARNKRNRDDLEKQDGDMEDGVPRKKTKKEVMQEIIAKSKMYKQERQEKQNTMNEQILDLDEDFDDLLAELKTTEKESIKQKKENAGSESKLENNIEFNDYDSKVKTFQFDKRAQPQDRVLSEKELLEKEEEEAKKLEKEREMRMRGIFNLDNEDEERLDIEKLDEGFWNDESDEDKEGEDADVPDSDNDIVFDEDTEKNKKSKENVEDIATFECPSTHKQLLTLLNDYPIEEHVSVVKKIISSYQPKLAEGNNLKLENLTKVIFQHLQFLVDTMKDEEEIELLDQFVDIFVKLISKYNNKLIDFLRMNIQSLQEKFEQKHESIVKPSTILFFSLVGFVYSTSDHYHLIVTPSLILINEFLEQLQFDSLVNNKFGCMLLEINNKYQNLSKRYAPESLFFVVKSLDYYISDKVKLVKDVEYEQLSIRKLNDKTTNSTNVLKNLLINITQSLNMIWDEKTAVNEIIDIVKPRLFKLLRKYGNIESIKDQINSIIESMDTIVSNNLHHPLILQNHRLISIPLVTPKFDDNFNPDKRYNNDISPQQNEINRLKKQVHKESKFQLKQFRKDSKFTQDLRTKEMIVDKQAYHDKMKRIVNVINTEEGSERNMYEKEKKMRQGKK